MTGSLITFEGLDFCGKSVQIERLTTKLQKLEIPYLLLREPGGTAIAEKIRETLLFSKEEKMIPVTEYLLYSSARAQLVQQKIIPALQEGKIVILDRYYDSSTAYQGYGRMIDLKLISQINTLVTEGIKPTITFFLDIDLEEMEKRKKNFNNSLDRIESEAKSFFSRVRNGFLKIVEEESERFYVIDGIRSINSIAEEIWEKVSNIVSK